MILKEDFEKAGCKVIIATDDGSFGHHGLVTECLDGVVADVIFACGPMPMLKALCNVRFLWKSGWLVESVLALAALAKQRSRTATKPMVMFAKMVLYLIIKK